jgi:arylsulfatase B
MVFITLCLLALARVVSGVPPRVIFFVMGDDIGNGMVGFTRGSPVAHGGPGGGSFTPHLDSLAAEGLVLDNAMAAFWCTPSRSSFLSGRLPVHVQMGQDFPETPSAGMPRGMGSLAAKLQAAGYSTHAIGKWDLGIATPGHTPRGRGFNSSLVYFEHMNEQYTQKIFPGGTACTLYNPTITDLWDGNGPATGLNGTGFLELLHRDRLMSLLADWDPVSGPNLFIYYAPHVAHYPLQVPQDWLERYGPDLVPDDEGACNATVPYVYPGAPPGQSMRCRAQGAALIGMLDEIVGNATALLKAKGVWQDTFFALQSDNGAPLDPAEAGGGNFPLRGGKYSSWQGGLQTPALVSGGVLPAARRGQREGGLLHIADWWATLIGLAGGDPSDAPAAAAGLPPVDSLDMWSLLSGAAPGSPRQEVPVDPSTLVVYPWKLLRGPQWWSGWQGPQYPNASSPQRSPNVWHLCGTGCLYNLASDPTESQDVAALHPQLVSSMSARLDVLAQGFFSNQDKGVDACPNGTQLCGCWAAVNTWGGYLGPYQV